MEKMNMLFNAGAQIIDRNRKVMREAKPDEVPRERPGIGPDGRPNVEKYFGEDQRRDMLHGHAAQMALDRPLESDTAEMKADPTGWVKKIMLREEIASDITDALFSLEEGTGDGWVELDTEKCGILVKRLGEHAIGFSNSMLGQVIRALEKPPKTKPARAAANGGNYLPRLEN